MPVPLLGAYTRWLHTMYPQGTVERLPEVQEDGSTAVPGVYVVGDLRGVPLLKFSTDSGARVVETIRHSRAFASARGEGLVDLVIIGAGVSGISAALRAKKLGLTFRLLESANAFSTIVNFPKRKPIYTYPREFTPDSELATTAEDREALLEELSEQVRAAALHVEEGVAVDRVARRGSHVAAVLADGTEIPARAAIIAIGRSGNFRRLGVPGEDLDKVSNRLHDPADQTGRRVLVVGGGDSALESAIALANAGGTVTLCYRGREFTRPKAENVEQVQALAAERRLSIRLASTPVRIAEGHVVLRDGATGAEETVPNDYVYTMLGREAPLEFFRKSRIPINGEWNVARMAAFAAFLLFCVWLYDWKSGGWFYDFFWERNWFPFNLMELLAAWSAPLAEMAADPANLLGTIAYSAGSPSFYYTLAYSLLVVVFGWRRIRRRRTPYVTVQTVTLAIIQVVPLFLLPEIILPWMGANGVFEQGIAKTIADGLFPGEGLYREYWRAYGLILAWPLFIYNFFTPDPMVWWLVIGSIQTFAIIPAMIYFWGKGSYCGWICSCGALAETLGDTHRHKMPHGLFWSRLNMTGQVILWIAVLGMGMRVWGWMVPDGWADRQFDLLYHGTAREYKIIENPQVATNDQVQWFQVAGNGEEPEWDFTVTDQQGNPVPRDHVAYDQEKNTLHGIPAWTTDPTHPAIVYTYWGDPETRGSRNLFSYKWTVDVLLAGIVGVGFYFWFSGRVWCRFACPLAALMHVYTKFSRFRILADKKKCISCNVCTSVCHQGIDIMNFANKGVPMEDPECVRCSACVQSCPTGVLQFGQVDRAGNVIRRDSLAASPVLMREKERQ